jgi:hypothetical protein
VSTDASCSGWSCDQSTHTRSPFGMLPAHLIVVGQTCLRSPSERNTAEGRRQPAQATPASPCLRARPRPYRVRILRRRRHPWPSTAPGAPRRAAPAPRQLRSPPLRAAPRPCYAGAA